MENNENNFIQVDIGFLLRRLWNYKLFIGLISLIFTGAALAYSLFIAVPKYTSTTKVYVVNQKKDDKAVTAQDIQLGNLLVKDFKEIIVSNKVMGDVISNNNLTLSAGALSKKITVDAPKDTRILSISVEDKDPVVAASLANAVRDEAAKQIKQVTKIDDVTTLEEAKVATSPFSPNIVKNAVLAFAVGLVLAVAFVLATLLLDDRIRRPEDIEEAMGLVLLGVVPDSKKG